MDIQERNGGGMTIFWDFMLIFCKTFTMAVYLNLNGWNMFVLLKEIKEINFQNTFNFFDNYYNTWFPGRIKSYTPRTTL